MYLFFCIGSKLQWLITGGNLGHKIKIFFSFFNLWKIFFSFFFNSDVFKCLWLFTLISWSQQDGKYKRICHWKKNHPKDVLDTRNLCKSSWKRHQRRISEWISKLMGWANAPLLNEVFFFLTLLTLQKFIKDKSISIFQ